MRSVDTPSLLARESSLVCFLFGWALSKKLCRSAFLPGFKSNNPTQRDLGVSILSNSPQRGTDTLPLFGSCFLETSILYSFFYILFPEVKYCIKTKVYMRTYAGLVVKRLGHAPPVSAVFRVVFVAERGRDSSTQPPPPTPRPRPRTRTHPSFRYDSHASLPLICANYREAH